MNILNIIIPYHKNSGGVIIYETQFFLLHFSFIKYQILKVIPLNIQEDQKLYNSMYHFFNINY